MQPKIQEILDELVRLDPELANREQELRGIIADMLENRPNPVLDEGFRQRLHQKINEEIQKIRQSEKAIVPAHPFAWIIPFLFGGAVFASLMVASPLGQYIQDTLHTRPVKTIPESTNNIAQMENSYTGTSIPSDDTAAVSDRIAQTLSGNETLTGMSARIPTPSSTPISDRSADRRTTIAFDFHIEKKNDRAFGTILSSPSKSAISTPGKAGDSGAESAKMMAPMSDTMIPSYEPTLYRYVYTGISIPLTDAKLTVLKKDNQRFQSSELNDFVQGFHFSGFDFGSFENLHLDSMTLSEDRAYGYQMNIDLVAGTIGVYRHWSKWPQSTCQTDECIQKERLELSDIPSRENLISIASDFIKKYRVDISHYGKPIINEDWRTQYDKTKDKSTAYIPDTISITYPLMIDGKEVLEGYGAPKGLTIAIDVRSKRVGELSGIEKHDFIGSDYEADMDFEHIRSLAEKGGENMPVFQMENTGSGKIVKLSLGTPTVSYVHLSEYKDNVNNEYLTQALVFPVTSTPKEGEYFPKSIIVPIVKEFQTTNTGNVPPYREPIMK